jgi:hypothetical protein
MNISLNESLLKEIFVEVSNEWRHRAKRLKEDSRSLKELYEKLRKLRAENERYLVGCNQKYKISAQNIAEGSKIFLEYLASNPALEKETGSCLYLSDAVKKQILPEIPPESLVIIRYNATSDSSSGVVYSFLVNRRCSPTEDRV